MGLLFPLRYPIICDTLYLGGMLISMCIWVWACLCFDDFHAFLIASFSEYLSYVFLDLSIYC